MKKSRALPVPLAAVLACMLAFPSVARSQEEPGQAVRRHSNGFLCLPYLGIHQPVLDRARYFPGLRAGSLFGYHFLGWFSLNAELTIDVLKMRTPEGGADRPYGSDGPSEAMVNFAFSPLVHFRLPGLHLILGPKLGYFRYTESRVEPPTWSLDDRNFHGYGWAYGINLGLFFPLNNVAVGALVNYAGHHFRTRCENDYRTDNVDVCLPPGRSDRHTLGLTGALLF